MSQLVKISIQKQLWEIKNNKFKLFFGIIVNILLLVFFYYSIFNQKDTKLLGLEYPVLILIYALLWLILSSFSQTSNIIANKAKIGTIEQLIVSPYGIRKIMLIRLFLQSCISIFFISIVLVISNQLTQNAGFFNIISFIITLIIGIFSLYGIGIILASISLLSKEINMINMIVKIGVLYLILKFDTNLFIPFSYAKNILTELLLNNKPITAYPISYLALFLLNSLIFFVLGLVCFGFIEKFALKKGKLTGY